MKNKMKKLAAMMLMVVLLCGSVLTAQAQCDHIGEARNFRTEIKCSYHEHDGHLCQIQRYYEVYDAYCTKCGILIAQPSKFLYEIHEPQ